MKWKYQKRQAASVLEASDQLKIFVFRKYTKGKGRPPHGWTFSFLNFTSTEVFPTQEDAQKQSIRYLGKFLKGVVGDYKKIKEKNKV